MRALVHDRFGDPAEVLTVREAPTPTPGPREVRVRMLRSPIHNHDLWTVRGSYGYRPELPARAGTEAVGVVEELGAGVTGLEVGQRVATGGTFGVWAEQFVARAGALVPVPDGLPDEQAAQLVSMPFSAISLIDSLELQPGDWLVQNAANGAVGRMVAQIGRARDINVLGLVRRDAAVAELAAQGIDRVVSVEDAGWRDRVAEITGGASIVAGVDSVGGHSSGQVLSLLGENGTLVVFGAMEAPKVQLSSGDLIFRQLTVKGFWGSTVSATMDAARRAELFDELAHLLASGALTLPVSATFPLDEVAEAVGATLSAGRVGKVLLRP
ncbi:MULTISPECIES: zinc-binding dehydrogenase [Microbacterium]|uniref:zinc-binding dehydrogenase n=1 Tax=Microbacterium TaxID=33882 RepID=UPI00214B246F|nr:MULTISPECIES: zinc-binding dehydrogenase [unclassified Microbacterium]MCR2813291.1 zinc-binding dehydrogenase [Microbacterium sp. zg.Y1084]MDL5487986.1 zinc-binding dehydrogenase [Microbacterium sp. zg-Y1211]